jgi:hypothetical protein
MRLPGFRSRDSSGRLVRPKEVRQKRQKVDFPVPASRSGAFSRLSRLRNQEDALSGPCLPDAAAWHTSKNGRKGKHAMGRMTAQDEVEKKHVEARVFN